MASGIPIPVYNIDFTGVKKKLSLNIGFSDIYALFSIKPFLAAVVCGFISLGLMTLFEVQAGSGMDKQFKRLNKKKVRLEKKIKRMGGADALAVIGKKQKREIKGFVRFLRWAAGVHVEGVWLNSILVTITGGLQEYKGESEHAKLAYLFYSELSKGNPYGAAKLRIAELSGKRRLSRAEASKKKRAAREGIRVEEIGLEKQIYFTVTNMKELTDKQKKKRASKIAQGKIKHEGF